MGANGAVGLRWAPIYGKLSLMGELAVHFQLYAWLGVGAAQLHRESLVYCLGRSGATCQSFVTEDRVSVIGPGALGLRFFLADHHAIKVEVRDYSYPDRYLENIVLADALANRPTGDPARNPGLTNLVQLDMGYSFVF